MYQYVSQYVINLHNLRMNQYVPRYITICNQSTQLKDKAICSNMYQYVINLHNLRMKQYVPICIAICNQST